MFGKVYRFTAVKIDWLLRTFSRPDFPLDCVGCLTAVDSWSVHMHSGLLAIFLECSDDCRKIIEWIFVRLMTQVTFITLPYLTIFRFIQHSFLFGGDWCHHAHTQFGDSPEACFQYPISHTFLFRWPKVTHLWDLVWKWLWTVGCSRQFWRSRQIWRSSPN